MLFAGWLEIWHFLRLVERVADKQSKLVITTPLHVMIAGATITCTIQNCDDLGKREWPELIVLQASETPLA